jgi:hypothetical protein
MRSSRTKRSHRKKRLSRRGRRIAAGAALAVALIVLGGGIALFSSGSGLVIPSDPCKNPPPLRTRDGVTLQPVALRAFRKAEIQADTKIAITASFRSCAQQAIACKNICGNAQGCPGRCAKPGTSYHQMGAAVDLSQASLHNPKIVAALQDTGWCAPLPSSDPGHFSYGGCH